MPRKVISRAFLSSAALRRIATRIAAERPSWTNFQVAEAARLALKGEGPFADLKPKKRKGRRR